MRIEGKLYLVVAGGMGHNDETIDSVELLDTSCTKQGWKMGMNE